MITQCLRPRDKFICKAVTLDGKPVEFYRLNRVSVSTTVYDTVDQDMKDTYQEFGIKEKYVVEAITMSEIISMLERVPDMMSIDIEGQDWDVLHNMNFQTFRPKVIIAELMAWGHYDHSPEDFVRFFKENGYILFAQTQCNGVFVDKAYESQLHEYLPDK